VRHHHHPPYRKSRGLVVLDFFETKDAVDFVKGYDLMGIEPFMLLIAENEKLYEFRWDGTEKYFKSLNENEPILRCSVTLYGPEIIAMREKWFKEWLAAHHMYAVNEILRFHLFAGEGDNSTDVRMSRAGLVKTVSVTSVESSQDIHRMYYTGVKEEKKFYFDLYSFDTLETPQVLSINL
jgi:hypothetical protein